MELLKEVKHNIADLDRVSMEKAQQRLDNLTKPPGSLGVLEELCVQLAGIYKNPMPSIDKKTVVVMAGDHGVVEEGVSAFPQEVTPQMVVNFLKGGAAINVLCRHAGASIKCVDIGVCQDIKHPQLIVKKVKHGTQNMVKGPAMSRTEAEKTIEIGIQTAITEIEVGADILATGEMGIGNTTPSSAILACYTDEPVEVITGRGTGLNDEKLKQKIQVIKKALSLNKPAPEDPIDVLSKVGGFEIGGLAGLILGAAYKRKPVVIDGFISSAAALIAAKIQPKAVNYMIPSHLSEEPGHKIALKVLGLKPMLRMNMRLGEGTGAALAFNLIEAAVKIIKEMATFDEAGVSKG